jgi:hypothetical protein
VTSVRSGQVALAAQTSVIAIICFSFALVATDFLLLPIEEIT